MPAYKLISVFIVAVLLNYLWELAQAPLYVGLENYNPGFFWHCFVASLGDGIMVLLIAAVGWISFQRWNWFERPGAAGYLSHASVPFPVGIEKAAGCGQA